MKIKVHGLILFSLICVTQVQAQEFRVAKPRSFSVVAPKSWVKGKIISGNTRISLVAPPGVPPAECAVVVGEFKPMKGQPQSALNQVMAEPPTASEMAAQLSNQYNNVRVLSAGTSIVAGYPAHIFNVQYSVGTPAGEEWARGIVLTTATTPGLIWSISCGATGKNPNEASKGYSFWQSEMMLFSTKIKIDNK